MYRKFFPIQPQKYLLQYVLRARGSPRKSYNTSFPTVFRAKKEAGKKIPSHLYNYSPKEWYFFSDWGIIFILVWSQICIQICNLRFALHRHRAVRQIMLEIVCRAKNAGNDPSEGQLWVSAMPCAGLDKGRALCVRRIKFESRIICRFLLCLSSLGRPCWALLNKHFCEMGAWSSHDIYGLIGRTPGLIRSTERWGFILFIKFKSCFGVSADVLQCGMVADLVEKF